MVLSRNLTLVQWGHLVGEGTAPAFSTHERGGLVSWTFMWEYLSYVAFMLLFYFLRYPIWSFRCFEPIRNIEALCLPLSHFHLWAGKDLAHIHLPPPSLTHNWLSHSFDPAIFCDQLCSESQGSDTWIKVWTKDLVASENSESFYRAS